ncbi:MAG TPA: hypothetical protein VFF27_13075 [Bacteroidia bacterium]|jgi:hypothetical protein|nr:hypothetical protein [Bacteroidia bacterium]
MAYEDRLKKQIEELARVLGKVLSMFFNGGGGSVADPFENLAQQVKEAADLDLKTLASVPSEQFIKAISETSLRKEHYELVADIFFQAGKSYISQEQEEKGKELYRKSIILLQHLTEIDKTYDQIREDKIAGREKLL